MSRWRRLAAQTVCVDYLNGRRDHYLATASSREKGGAEEGAISLARGLVELIIHAAQQVVQTSNW